MFFANFAPRTPRSTEENTEEDRGAPRSTKERRAKPSRTEQNRGEPRRTEENRGEPRRTEENWGEQRWEHWGGPRSSDENTEEDQGEPRRTEENRGEPRRTEENRGEPRRTEENRGEHWGTVRSSDLREKTQTTKKTLPILFWGKFRKKWQFLGKMSRFWSEGVFGTFSVFSPFPSKKPKNHKVGATEKGKEDRNEKNKEEWVRNDKKPKRRRLEKKGIWKRGEYEEKGADWRWWKKRW